MDERERRVAVIGAGIHSANLEGGDVTPEFCRDARDYIAGSIDLKGLLDLLNHRYGTHNTL